MQYLLTKDEYDNLVNKKDDALYNCTKTLQLVCSEYANYHHKKEGHFGGGACKNGEPFIYCSDCPAHAFCPSTGKEYSK